MTAPTHPNPETARRIMRREGFRWVQGMRPFVPAALAVLARVSNFEEATGAPLDGLWPDYTDARTAEILDEIVPGWREEVER